MTDSKVYGIGIVAVAVLVIGVFTLPSEETFISVPPPVRAWIQASDGYDQVPISTDPYEITLSDNDQKSGIIHVANMSDITVEYPGEYFVMMAPQVGRDSTGGAKWVDFWFRVNDVDVPDSGVRAHLVNTADATDVIIMQTLIELNATDHINLMMGVESIGQGLGMHHIDPVGKPDIPSIIFTMYKVN